MVDVDRVQLVVAPVQPLVQRVSSLLAATNIYKYQLLLMKVFSKNSSQMEKNKSKAVPNNTAVLNPVKLFKNR